MTTNFFSKLSFALEVISFKLLRIRVQIGKCTLEKVSEKITLNQEITSDSIDNV